jgi:hypothetical protein
MIGPLCVTSPHPSSPNEGERADDKVGEPDTKEPGIPEGIPTTARPLIGRMRSVRTKKYRHVAVVVRLCDLRSPNPIAVVSAMTKD